MKETWKKGKIHVYMGEGKGKTSAAFGLALRAAGRGLPVCIVQFLKGQESSGEVHAIKLVPEVHVVQFGSSRFIKPDHSAPRDVKLAREGMDYVKSVIRSNRYRLIILDEINVALHFDLVELEEIITLLETKPPNLELVLTGRYPHEEVLKRADLVTEMLCIKHYYNDEFPARLGIEY